MLLDQFPKLHVFDYFHAQGAHRPDLLIDASANQVKWTETDVILRIWIINLPRPMTEYEKKCKGTHHHALAWRLKNMRRKDDQVVRPRRFRVRDGTAQRVCA